jgi:hypothetical protein
MNTNIEVLRELDELVEAARLLGVTQAKKLFGCHTDEDRRFERAMYESIDKHRAALLDWEAKQPAPPSTPVRVSWADFWIAQGDWPTANDYAAFEKAEQWLLAQQPAAVDDPDVQSAEVEALRKDAERWRALREMDGGEIYALLGDCDGIHPEQADAAIDQARGKGGQS